MLVAERKAGVLDRVRQVEDEQVLKMIEAILEVHLGAVDNESVDETGEEVGAPGFNPFEHYSKEEIKHHKSRADFWGYRIDGQPIFGNEVHDRAEETLAAADRGEIKLTTQKEFKAKMDKKRSEWQSRTK